MKLQGDVYVKRLHCQWHGLPGSDMSETCPRRPIFIIYWAYECLGTYCQNHARLIKAEYIRQDKEMSDD